MDVLPIGTIPSSGSQTLPLQSAVTSDPGVGPDSGRDSGSGIDFPGLLLGLNQDAPNVSGTDDESTSQAQDAGAATAQLLPQENPDHAQGAPGSNVPIPTVVTEQERLSQNSQGAPPDAGEASLLGPLQPQKILDPSSALSISGKSRVDLLASSTAEEGEPVKGSQPLLLVDAHYGPEYELHYQEVSQPNRV